MVFLQERIGRLLQEVEELCYPESVDIPSYLMCKTAERFDDIAGLDTSGWEMFDCRQIWGGHNEYYWFETEVIIPDSFDGKCVVYDIRTGREGEWDANNPQFSFYVNGVLRQGLDVNHREVLLTHRAKAGDVYRIVLAAFTGVQNWSLLLKSRLRVLDEATQRYYYDISVPYHTAVLLEKDDPAYLAIIPALNESLNLLDLRRPFSEEYCRTLGEAESYIQREFYEKYGDAESEPVVCCIGHTHIDVAWLWTLSVTEDKAVRSFSTVLELMRRYPEYLFMSSQPQLYAYVKKNAPEIYEQIKARVAEGRWEVNGGMWLEADCNIASGESLVRQFVHGKRFFREEFDKDNDILWLPDVFGYSAALPQIMKGCGVPYFMTTKISWNEFNKMPYDTFLWEGIDGTKVLTHFISSRDYNNPGEVGSFRTGHYTTYCGFINPSYAKGGWQRYQQKHLGSEILNCYGYGDGGGGPTSDMLEQQRRLSKGIPGVPRTKMGTASSFFRRLDEQVSGNKYLPTWSGELYLEYHRGTYTSMSRNKKYNRKSEFAILRTEWLGVLENSLLGAAYPAEELDAQWKVILRNQFHDILPGSSIREVYEDSKAEYEGVLHTLRALSDASMQHLADAVGAPEGSLVLFNPNGFPLSDAVSFTPPGGMVSVLDGDTPLPCQQLSDGRVSLFVRDVPARGYKTLYLSSAPAPEAEALRVTAGEMENRFFRLRLNEKGQFTSIFDKRAGRELIPAGERANVLMTYEDKPHNYDAWDVNNYYKEKSWEVDDVQSIEAVNCGAVSASLRIVRRYLESSITQTVTLYRDIPRIDIRNQIDWKEKQIFLKDLFPVDIHTNEATFDIQYGNVTRPTHYNTSWDFARFEVCHHKWLDISEAGYGVSFLNDCKYGCSVHEGVVGLSMLKSATYPNPDADKEYQEFTYSIYPHLEGWREAGTVQAAYALNNPLSASVKSGAAGTLPASCSFVRSENANVIIEVVKQADCGEGIILRVYECHNRRTDATLTFSRSLQSARVCDMLENPGDSLSPNGNTLSFSMRPYEIKTLLVTFQNN